MKGWVTFTDQKAQHGEDVAGPQTDPTGPLLSPDSGGEFMFL